MKILIIRRDNIGDLVCTTPAIAGLRQRYPHAEIAALVNSYNVEVLHGNPNLDRVYVYQKLKHVSGLLGRMHALVLRARLIIQLRRWKPDITILAKASYDRHGLNFARLIGAKGIIGYVPDGQVLPKRLPDVRIATPEFTSVHEVEAVHGLLHTLGVSAAPGKLEVYPDPKEVLKLKHKLPAAAKRIALHISAREPERRWGFENFTALARHILQTYPESQVLLFWSPGKADDPHHPGDDGAAEQLQKKISNQRLVPMDTQSLRELIAALSLCDVFIGADGGAMHLAAALNKKVLALFENQPSKIMHWYPWKTESCVVHSEVLAMLNIDQISQNQVFEALSSVVRWVKMAQK